VTERTLLKLVVAYDRNRNEYSIAAHNQTPEEADLHLARWSEHLRPGCSFIVLAQARRHRTEQAGECRACHKTVARSAHPEPQPHFKKEA